MFKLGILIAAWIGCTLSAFPQATKALCPSGTLQPIIWYSVRGGLMGITSEWIIFKDGTVCSGDHLAAKLTNDAVRLLLDQISAGFFNLKGSYRDAKAAKLCHQCNYYKITVQIGNRRKTVEMHDGAKNVPRYLWEMNSRIQHELKLARPCNSGDPVL